MFRTLDRYLLRSFLANYLVSMFVLISLYVVLDLFVNFDEFTEKGERVITILHNVGDYYYYYLPLYFSQLSGVITLFAACLTLARMHRLNEVTAVLASGTSMYRLATPIILAGVFMNALLWLDHELVLPRVAPKLARQRDDVEGMRTVELWCVRDGQGRLISALQFWPGHKRMQNLMVMELSTEPGTRGQLLSVVRAYRADWDEQRHGWRLDDGWRHRERDHTTSAGNKDLISERVSFYPCDLSPAELQLRKTAQWIRFLSLGQLDELLKRGTVKPEQIAQIKHLRFTMPINNMILLLMGLAFFMHRLPGSVLSQGAKALAMCTFSFVVALAGQRLVGSADFSPALSAWVPVFLFGPVAVLLLDNVKT